MAKQLIIDKSIITDICDAIREKKGTTDIIPSANIATEIRNLQTGGLIEADELPESAEDGTFYRIIGDQTATMYYTNYNGYLINMGESNAAGRWVDVQVVSGIPDQSDTSRSSSTYYTLYYVPSTNQMYWNEDGLKVTNFDNWTWVVVSSEDEMTDSSTYYLLVETTYTYHYYLNGAWHEVEY